MVVKPLRRVLKVILKAFLRILKRGSVEDLCSRARCLSVALGFQTGPNPFRAILYSLLQFGHGLLGAFETGILLISVVQGRQRLHCLVHLRVQRLKFSVRASHFDECIEQRGPLAVCRLQVFQIGPVRQGILREGEERVCVRVRFAKRGGQTPPRIGAAEIDTAGGNGVNNAVDRHLSVLWVAVDGVIVCQANFQHRLPIAGSEARVSVLEPFGILRMVLLETGISIGHRLPISLGCRIKKLAEPR